MQDTEKKSYLNAILEEIFSLDNPSISQERKGQIYDFVKLTINGDMPKAHLSINANLGNNNRGVIVYILTNIRFIKIDIDTKEIQSFSFSLDTMISVDRKLIDGDRAEINISFQKDSFGLRYAPSDKKIIDFFQKVDQSRRKKDASNG